MGRVPDLREVFDPPDEIVQAGLNGDLVFFVGAGASMLLGLPSWAGLAEKALNDLGASLQDVVKTRIYVSDINNWKEIGKAHGEFFKDIKPASTLFEVSTLIGLDFLVEIEATAIVDE